MQRKPIFTLLACVLLSGPALAQSSITAYGMVDAMLGKTTGAINGVNALDKSVAVLSGAGMSTSHWGIRGSEDLGGGFHAIFDVSSFFRSDTGQPGRSDAIGPPVNISADPFFSRASHVGLSSKTLGTVRLGNYRTSAFFDAVVSNAFGDSMQFSPLQMITNVGGPLSGGTSWTDQISYESPRWGAMSFSVEKSFSENRGGGNMGARMAFADGPTALSLVWQDVKKDPLTFADGTTSADTRSWRLGASHDFRWIRLFAHLGRIENRGSQALRLQQKHKVWDISASIPLGYGKVLLAYGERGTNDAVAPQSASLAGGNVKRQVMSIGYDHLLSKRTDLYVVAMQDKTLTNTLPSPGTRVQASGTNFGIGMRHRF